MTKKIDLQKSVLYQVYDPLEDKILFETYDTIELYDFIDYKCKALICDIRCIEEQLHG